MKTKLLIIVFLLSACTPVSSAKKNPSPEIDKSKYTPISTIATWQNEHALNQNILQEGTISKILQDDNEGCRHQKFIVKLSTGTTLLIAHNIDISSRIPDLENGETIVFCGEYEWNKKGGVVHWTHHDPNHKHMPGFLQYKGVRYD